MIKNDPPTEHIVLESADGEKTRAPAAGAYEGKTERVEDHQQITALLQRLRDAHALLSVTIPGHPGSYNSAVIEVYPDHGHFVLDELSPQDGHKLLVNSGRARVQARLKGVAISFEAGFQTSGRQDGVAFYNFSLPTLILYQQHRAHYRAKVGHAKRIPIRITRQDGSEVTAELNDISVGGLGMRFSRALPEGMDRGEVFSSCTVRLPTGDELSCRLEVRFTSVGVTGNVRLVGARFLELSPAQQAAIARFVAQVDRESRRKASQIIGD
jgi:c-di-GMP-binding flagellar brake protein YcgR